MSNQLELGYGRSKTIPDSCCDCKKLDLCIKDLLSESKSKNELLKKYLTKAIDLECLVSEKAECTSDAKNIAQEIGQALISADLYDLVELLRSCESREPITSDNIPQYGDLSVSMYLIPDILINNEHLGFIELGKKIFYRAGKTDEAYRKYAEYHSKLAAQLDLAVIKRKKPSGFDISSSVMGKYYVSLPMDEKDLLLPKLCLRIPIIQEALLGDDREATIHNGLSILSPTTIQRRKKGIIDLVDFTVGE